jgi:hypothetical protein
MKVLIPIISLELSENLSHKISEKQSSAWLQCFFNTRQHRKKDVTDRKRGKPQGKAEYKRELLGYRGFDLTKKEQEINGDKALSSEETQV